MTPTQPAVLVALFDGQCNLCMRTAQSIQTQDPDGRIECVDLRQPAIAARFPDITPNAARAALHVVDTAGEVHVGVEALRVIGDQLPGWKSVAWTLSVPGIRDLAKVGYGVVARNRLTLNKVLAPAEAQCDDGSCAVDWDALEE